MTHVDLESEDRVTLRVRATVRKVSYTGGRKAGNRSMAPYVCASPACGAIQGAT